MNFYSQYQEDFYIDHVCREQKITIPKTVIELGAHDGIFLSNSRFFVEQGWEAVLVECNKDTIPILKENSKGFDVTIITNPICAKAGLVSFNRSKEPTHSKVIEGGADELQAITYDQMLKMAGWQDKPIGVLSIDIEGMDTEVLKGVVKAKHLPAWIVIESNTQKARADQMRILLDAGYHCINVFDFNTIWIKSEVATWIA